MKIVVCGPPHSGKSVFVQELRRRLLPLGVVGVIEGCPDGEGGWAGATSQELASELRRKGKFTAEFVGWVLASVKGAVMPITLVDVGGVRSPENERIFRECDSYIVLANPTKVGELAAWDAFGRAHGCKPVALLDSVLHGTTVLAPDQGDGVVRGVQAGLERGEQVGGPVLEALVANLLAVVGRQALPGEMEANVHTGRLADQLGIPVADRDARLGFRPWHAAGCKALTADALAQPLTRLWGACSAWLAAEVAANATGQVELWDIRLGWVGIPELPLAPAPSTHLTWRVEKDNGHTLVSFSVPSQVFDIAQLGNVVVPAVEAGAKVVLSGRGPHWLVAAVACAYARAGHMVAVLALHETSASLPGGKAWSEVYPTLAPAVVVAGGHTTALGTVITVPVGLIK